MVKAGLYVRVSTQEQKEHGYSIDNQIDALKQYCTDNGMYVYRIYNDAGISAHASYKKRPALLDMIDDCQNKKIDVILFTRIDRFFRSIKDYYLVMDQLGSVPWRAIWEDYNTQTSEGQFRVNLMLSIAEAEASRTSEKIKSVISYKKANGEIVCGRQPTGYLRKDKKLIIDPEKHDGVQAFFDTYTLTRSMSLSRSAALEHGVVIKKATAVRMLHNPTYCGHVQGIDVDPYITQQQFDDNQFEMSKYNRDTGKRRTYIFSGILYCDCCGGHMVSRVSRDKLKDGSISERKQYVCGVRRNDYGACQSKTIGEKFIESEVINAIREYAGNKKPAGKKKPPVDNTKKITALKSRLDRVGIRFEDGDLSIDEYREKRSQILDEIKSLETYTEKKDISLPDDWEDMYYKLDDAKKHMFFANIIKRIYINEERRVGIEFK